MEKVLKKPLTKEELTSLFDTGNLPAFMLQKPNYLIQDIRNFYIGINRIDTVDSRSNKAYKYYVKKLIAINSSVRLPYRKNKLIRNWGVKPFKNNNPIVIIIDVEEIDFSLDKVANLRYNLIGIYSTKDFEKNIYKYFSNQVTTDYLFDEFSPLMDPEEEDLGYVIQLAKIKKTSKKANKVSINKPIVQETVELSSEDNLIADQEDDVTLAANDYISQLLDDKPQVEPEYQEVVEEIENEENKNSLEDLYEEEIPMEKREKIYNNNLELMTSEFGDSAIDNNIKYNSNIKNEKINKTINDSIIEDKIIKDYSSKTEFTEEANSVLEDTFGDDINIQDSKKIQDNEEYFGIK